jgi:hypothetical protein
VFNVREAFRVPLLYWSRFRTWYGSLSSAKQTFTQNAFIWGVTALCIWWVFRGVSFHNFFKSLREARIGLFIAANVASFFL